MRSASVFTCATMAGVKSGSLPAVSANLLDSGTSQPLFESFIIKNVGRTKLAMLGICEPPAGLAYLPSLRQQLAGMTIADPEKALAQALPQAKAQADQVVLLYYGSPAGLGALLRAHQSDIALVVAGGFRREQLPADL